MFRSVCETCPLVFLRGRRQACGCRTSLKHSARVSHRITSAASVRRSGYLTRDLVIHSCTLRLQCNESVQHRRITCSLQAPLILEVLVPVVDIQQLPRATSSNQIRRGLFLFLLIYNPSVLIRWFIKLGFSYLKLTFEPISEGFQPLLICAAAWICGTLISRVFPNPSNTIK